MFLSNPVKLFSGQKQVQINTALFALCRNSLQTECFAQDEIASLNELVEKRDHSDGVVHVRVFSAVSVLSVMV